MLKSFVLLAILLNSTSSHFIPNQDVCKKEETRWNDCFQVYINGTMELVKEAQNRAIISSTMSTVTAVSQDKNPFLELLKETFKCTGDLTCKGQRKFLKFMIETLIFSIENFQNGISGCIVETEQETVLDTCIFSKHEKYMRKIDYNGEVITCSEKILAHFECDDEHKKLIRKAAMAQDDFLKLTVEIKKDEKLFEEKFDKTFDPTKYD